MQENCSDLAVRIMTDKDASEILVVGSGPAGISTVLWLRDLELPFRWISSDRVLGGTLNRVSNPISNFAGIEVNEGRQLVPHFAAQLRSHGLQPELETRLVHLSIEKGPHGRNEFTASIDGDNGTSNASTFGSVVLATGTRPRMLGLPNEVRLLGHGVEISVSGARSRYEGLATAIVGGGDAAFEGALLLAEMCPRVYLVHRSHELRTQQRFFDAVQAHQRIEVILGDEIMELLTDADNAVEGVRLTSGRELAVRGLFERIGVEPAVPSGLEPEVVCEHGYLITERHGRTSVSGLYAVGDVADREHQSVAWAVGSGAHVATAIQRDLGRRSGQVLGE